MKTERIVFSADGVVKNIVKEQGDDSLISDSLPPLTFDDDMNTIPILTASTHLRVSCSTDLSLSCRHNNFYK